MSEMKVSEAIDRLKVGDTVWIKGKVLEKDTTEQPLYVDFGRVGSLWLYEEHEFYLTEPKNEKVEVPDYVAEWIEYAKKKGHTVIESANPWDLYGAEWKKADDWINQNQDSFARAFMDGYTVKPKRWVVKYLRHRCYYYFVEWANTDTFDPIGGPDLDYLKVAEFTDKSKAEAVAVLVEGSVEEV